MSEYHFSLRYFWQDLCFRFVWLELALWATALSLVVVIVAHYRASREILVTKGGVLPESFVETPDYYVVAVLTTRELVRTNGYANMPIGNGLRFKLPYALRPSQISHLCLMNEDLILDDVVEQVEMNGRKAKGQQYQFELVAPASVVPSISYAVLLAGAGYLLYVIVWLVRLQAV